MIGTIIEIILLTIAVVLILFELVVMWKNSEVTSERQDGTDREIRDIRHRLDILEQEAEILMKKKE